MKYSVMNLFVMSNELVFLWIFDQVLFDVIESSNVPNQPKMIESIVVDPKEYDEKELM